MKKIVNIALLFILAFCSFTTPAKSKLLTSLKESLDSAFPRATSVEKRTIFLSDKQVQTIKKISGMTPDSKIHIFYEFKSKSEVLGYGIIDSHVLRTKSETVLYLIDRNGNLINSEILAFFEPPDYMPSAKWLDLFDGKNVNDELRVGKKIPNITGATITSHEFSRNTRKILAIYKVALNDHN